MIVRKALLVVAFPALLAQASPAAAPETSVSGFDTPPVLDAADFLPPALLKGPNHEVDRKVTNDGVSNFYTIRTPYGDFQTAGTSLVVVRVGEINAIAELKSLDKVAVGAKGVVSSVVESGKGAVQIVTHPVETVTGLAGGAARLFGRIKRAVQRTSEQADYDAKSGQPKSTEQKVAETSGSLAEELVGVNYTTRLWARKLNVDPYTPNPLLHDELQTIARYDAGGRFLVKAAPIGVAGTVLGGATAVNDLVWEKEPDELRILNEKRLAAMGATPDQSRAFRLNKAYGITRQTDFVASLDTLSGVAGRGDFVERAALASNDAEAQFFADSANLMKEFHLREAPLDAIHSDQLGPCATSGKRRFACFFPLDYVVWTESVAGNVRDMTERARAEFPGATREMWITGRVSPRTAQELHDCGWTVYELTALAKTWAGQSPGTPR
jgi:hypothetical protein